MAKYMMSHPCFSSDMQEALRKAFNLNPAYPIKQGCIIVRSRGVAHANQVIEEQELPYCIRGCFHRNYSSSIGNEDLISQCESAESGIILSYRPCASNREYISWDKFKEYLN